MWKKLLFVIVVVSALLLSGAAQAAHDVTRPGDIIQGVPNDGISQNDNHGWPGNEPPHQAIDDRIDTKYLHFKGEIQPTGIRITPAAGATVVIGLTFTTANDAVPRDPISYELSGSNESIDGPWTLIAAGPIVDFAAGTWPRRTKNTTPIRFANDVAYKHYQLMFPAVFNPGGANSMQIAEVELLAADLTALNPSPANRAIGVQTPLIQWAAGDTARWHDVYFGTNPTPGPAELVSPRQMWTMYWHAPGLAPGTTYYWRIDEVEADGTTIHEGDVWSFTAASLTAYDPGPKDGAKWIDIQADLSWAVGVTGVSHDVYFGTDENAVANGTGGTFKGNQFLRTFDPGTLAQNTTYYWRVDEVEQNGTTKHAGEVWSFTTAGPGGGIKGEYFSNTTLSGMPALVRIDPEVNVNLSGNTSPGAPIPGDGWSARWTADLDIDIADTFTFAVNCQDGTRLWIDGELIIDQWVTPTVTSKYYSLPIYLERGIHSLRLEYFDSGGDAVEQLYWSTPTMAERIIPAGPLQPPLRASGPNPPDGAVDVKQTPTLRWSPGDKAAQHDVYFGTDKTAVANANTTNVGIYRGRQNDTNYVPSEVPLEWDQTYYWRVDEVNNLDPGSPWKGSVWSFTTANFIIVDNFEDYDDVVNRIFDVWGDYFVNNTGATVGWFDPPFAEQTIVHGGSQSMPYRYDNDGTVNEGTAYEKTGTKFYSEVEREWATPQDWTRKGVASLRLYFQGAAMRFAESAGAITMSAAGADIWGTSDQFRYAYKQLNGDGQIVAKVVSIGGPGTNEWRKAGVMIRESLDAGSRHAFMAITPAIAHGVAFQNRPTMNSSSFNASQNVGFTTPAWVKLVRQGGQFTGYYSTNGVNWVQVPASTASDGSPNPQTIAMSPTTYIGLALTSHQSGVSCVAQFSDVTITGATGAWTIADIGVAQPGNDPAPMYVVLQDSANKTAVVKHSDPAATLLAAWTEWNIPLTDFTGLNLRAIKKIYIGVGDRANPLRGGSGRLYIDDIQLRLPPPAQ